MSLDTVKATVLESAGKKAKEIRSGAEFESEKIIQEAKAASDRETTEVIRDAKLRAERAANRELERIQYESRLRILQAKNDAIDEVFRRVKTALAGLSDDECVGMVATWLKALPKDAGGTLRVNPRDEAKFASRLGAFNEARSDSGKFRGVTPDPRIESGAVLDGPDFTVDCTFGRRLDELRETTAGAVAKALFM